MSSGRPDHRAGRARRIARDLPAGADCGTKADESLGAPLVAVEPDRFSIAAAEDASLDAQLVERLSGEDHALLGLAQALALECTGDYPNGPLL